MHFSLPVAVGPTKLGEKLCQPNMVYKTMTFLLTCVFIAQAMAIIAHVVEAFIQGTNYC